MRRLDETEYRDVDVRVISASHRDLRELVNRGAFREDLYFRLAVVPVRVPTLRERPEDVPLLVEHFLSAKKNRLAVPQLVMDALVARSWEGNVRELRNVVDRACILGWASALAAIPSTPL